MYDTAVNRCGTDLVRKIKEGGTRTLTAHFGDDLTLAIKGQLDAVEDYHREVDPDGLVERYVFRDPDPEDPADQILGQSIHWNQGVRLAHMVTVVVRPGQALLQGGGPIRLIPGWELVLYFKAFDLTGKADSHEGV